MGALFSIFASNQLKDFELLWGQENIASDDATVFEEGQILLITCNRVKLSLQEYKGCKDELKEAMSTKQGTTENQEATRQAMQKVGPNAALCGQWYDCAVEVANFLQDKLFPLLATRLNTDDNKTEEKKEEQKNADISEIGIFTHQALSKQTCELLDFLLSFDQLKMRESQVQNDFSFYKRTLVKCDSDESLSDLPLPVNSEKAGMISMFLAHAIPMMKEVANMLKESEFSLKMLATICNACADLLRANNFGDAAYHNLVLRAMVASFVIYDHANKIGGFQRRSLTRASKVVSIVCNEYTQAYGEHEGTDGLVNVIKYSSLHVNDEQTPQSIRRMLQL